jgi:ParB-like chromosome segregation protein Spo0J
LFNGKKTKTEAKMKIENVPASKLKAAEYNPRKIAPDVMEKLVAGIKEYGIVDPIIINKDDTIIGGHQRFQAALEIGIKSLPCVRLDLTKEKEKALNIALNKIIGEFDMPKLTDLLISLDDESFKLTGFTEVELMEMQEIETELLQFTEKELKPYKMTHVLISFPPEKMIRIKKHLEEIIKIEGIEYEQGSNG